jgi:hypothetical protein
VKKIFYAEKKFKFANKKEGDIAFLMLYLLKI